MKAKKLTALVLAGVMTLSMAGCGNGNSGSNTASNNNNSAASSSNAVTDSNTSADSNTDSSGEKIVVWTLADDLKQFAERYTEQTGVEFDINVIAPADYPTKMTSALDDFYMQVETTFPEITVNR